VIETMRPASDSLEELRVRRLVEAVNAEVSLVRLLVDEGFATHGPDQARSIKQHCPWGWTHADGGDEKAFRIYHGNTAYCFAGCGYVDPIIFAMKQWDLSRLQAAKELALRYDVRAGDLESTIESLRRPSEVSPPELVDALRRWVRGQWGDTPDHAAARTALIKCASVIEYVSGEASAAVWWERSQQHIAAAVEQSRRSRDAQTQAGCGA
jgi:hypothetical protein